MDKDNQPVIEVEYGMANDISLFSGGMEATKQASRIAFKNDERLADVEAQKEKLIKTNEVLLKEISECKKIEAVLRESETKLKEFVDAMFDGSLIIDEDGRYIGVFDGGSKQLKRPKEDLKGNILQQIFREEDNEAILRKIRQTISLGMPQCFAYELNGGEEKNFFEGKIAPIGYLANGKKTVAAIVVDVTERLKAEKMLEFAYGLRRKSDFINDIIAENIKINESTIANAKTFGFDFSVPVFCCLLTVGKLAEETTNIQRIKFNIIELLSRNSEYLTWDCHKGIGILCQVRDRDDDWKNSMQFALQLQKKIASYDLGVTMKIGVSNMHVGIDSLKQAYRQAWSAVVAMRCQSERSKAINHYRDIGIVQLLTNIDGKRQAIEFINEKLGKLIEYDHKKGADFLLTLEKILQSNNLKAAAETMYIHHKTMVFRKQRIEKILEVSIDEFETKLALGAAIKLYKLSNTFNK